MAFCDFEATDFFLNREAFEMPAVWNFPHSFMNPITSLPVKYSRHWPKIYLVVFMSTNLKGRCRMISLPPTGIYNRPPILPFNISYKTHTHTTIRGTSMFTSDLTDDVPAFVLVVTITHITCTLLMYSMCEYMGIILHECTRLTFQLS